MEIDGRHPVEVAGEIAHRNLVRGGVLPDGSPQIVIDLGRQLFSESSVTLYLPLLIERAFRESVEAGTVVTMPAIEIPPADGSIALPGPDIGPIAPTPLGPSRPPTV